MSIYRGSHHSSDKFWEETNKLRHTRVFHVYHPSYDFRHKESTDLKKQDHESAKSDDGRSRDRSRHSDDFRDSTRSNKDKRQSNDWSKEEGSVDDELDLDRELFPLEHYIKDRPRLIHEAFGILQGRRLEAMLPTAVKGCSMKYLEKRCMDIMEDLSDDVLNDILNGKVATGPEKLTPGDNGSQSGADVKKKKKRKKSKDEADAPVAKKEKKKAGKELVTKKTTKKKKHKPGTTEDNDEPKAKKKHKTSKLKTKSKKKKRKSKADDEDVYIPGLGGQKTLMELLELEFRAKAIKALLRTQGVDGTSIDSALKEESPTSTSNEKTETKAASQEESETLSSQISEAITTSQPSQESIDTEKCEETDLDKTLVDDKSACSSQNQDLNITADSTQSVAHNETTEGHSSDEKTVSSSNIPQDESNCDVFQLVDEALSSSLDVPKSQSSIDESSEVPNPMFLSSVTTSDNEESQKLRSKLERQYRKREGTLTQPEETVPKDEDDVLVLHATQSQFEKNMILDEDEVETITNAVSSVGTQESIVEVPEVEEGEIGSDEDDDELCSQNSAPSPAYDRRRSWRQISPGKSEDDITSSAKSRRNHDDSPEGELINDYDMDPVSPDSNRSSIGSSSKVYNSTVSSAPASNRNVSKRLISEDELIYSGDEINENSEEEENIAECTQVDNVENSTAESLSEDEMEEITDGKDLDELDVIAENENDDEDGEEEPKPVTWYERWYQSKKVQKVMNSSKVYGKVRKKLKVEKAKDKIVEEKDDNAEAVRTEIIGSIEEYERLFGKTTKDETTEVESSPVLTQQAEVSKAPLEPEAHSEHEDNDEDEDLWGDILGS